MPRREMRGFALALLYPLRHLAWQLDATGEDGDATAAVLYSGRGERVVV